MKGKLRVRKRDTRAEAKQGTATSGWPLRTVRIRLVAKGVLVMDVFRPATESQGCWHMLNGVAGLTYLTRMC